MARRKRSTQEIYSETEAAAELGIGIDRLYELLDQYIFTGGSPRAPALQFTSSDLLLLSYWSDEATKPSSHEVIPMPKRK
jgi:hypothetical protein